MTKGRGNLDGTPHCLAHCSACGSHFRSVRAFDLHRAGSYRDGKNRYCKHPERVKTVEALTHEGVCDVDGEPVAGVTIWRETE